MIQILRILKYFTFAGKNDDVVKLYDLTSLSEKTEFNVPGQSNNYKEDNPYTVPVAMLLYSVAINMKNSKDDSKKVQTICALLKSSLKLLNNKRYPQVCIVIKTKTLG